MRRFIVLLVFLFAACAPPPQPIQPEITPEAQAVIVDGTLATSLLATTWDSSPEDNALFPLDPSRGTALPGYEPIPLGYSSYSAFSSDWKTLAVVSFPTETAYHGSLLLIDLSTWKTRKFELDLQGWASAMVFSPDQTKLAIAHSDSDYHLSMVDVKQGKITAQAEVDSFVSRLKFTRSGETLMLYRPGASVPGELSPAAPQVSLLAATDLSPRWSAGLENVRDGIYPADETVKTQVDLYKPGNALYFSPGLVFAPDQDVLYIAHADSAQLTTVDFDGQTIKTLNIQPKLSWFERLLSLDAGIAHAKVADGTSKQAAISPDGHSLYVVGTSRISFEDQQKGWQMEETPLGLDVIQTSDAYRVEHFETDATELSLSSDGRFLYLRNWGDGITLPWTEIFDTASRKLSARKEAFYATPAPLLNGQYVLASTYVSMEEPEQNHMSVLQPSDLSVLAEWTGPSFIYWLTP